MTAIELFDVIGAGETSKVQFKRELDSRDKIAAEMIAFSNTKGGMILFGVEDKTGEITGLDYEALQKAGNAVATIASDLVKPLIYITTEVVQVDAATGKKNVLIVCVDEGLSKPYKDLNGTIWIKQGADKRKMTDNAEILRLFQQSGRLYIDEMEVAGTSVNDIDKEKVAYYVKKVQKDVEEFEKIDQLHLYTNLNILKNSRLTLGGLLFFSKNPQRYKPTFCIKAVSFFGNSIGGSDYRDSIDINGAIPQLFEEGMRFFKTNLLHQQKGQNFNSIGILEISEIALEELLQNALIHRDYTKNAPIRLMIFDNRIEIVSPGCLPNSLTVENIKFGNAAVRNNLLISYCSKLMSYRGFGSGIIRAINNQPNIELINDVEGEQFIVKIPRETSTTKSSA
ncbi:MAG: putative DNA binding domain-containing protein [Prevotellaceae bacterium]|jgi:predicted HTH transcriptional regulator|nr:putative DNA binding domain-containing protein [Prevotellaceae bacterium]